MGKTDVGHLVGWDARLTSELVLLFLYVGVIACGTPSTTAVWRAVRQVFWCDWRGESADYSLLRGVVEHPAQGSTRMQQSIDPAMRSPLRCRFLASCCCLPR